MSYKDAYHPKVKADLRKLDKPVVREIHNIHLDGVLEKPYAGENLYGDLEGVFSYHFRKNKVDYRIAYTVDDEKKVVYIIMIGKRENFYEILKRRLP
jgi:addiction module RelE/StbE family toxin